MRRSLVTKSATIKSYGWDPQTKIFEVEFHHGGIYQYADVPELMVISFRSAESKGKFFHKQIRGKFAVTKLPEEQPLQFDQEQPLVKQLEDPIEHYSA